MDKATLIKFMKLNIRVEEANKELDSNYGDDREAMAADGAAEAWRKALELVQALDS